MAGLSTIHAAGPQKQMQTGILLNTDTDHPPPSSTPPTLTAILTGNGDIPAAFVINGTAVRPRSDEV
jgi:hypothetical protein